MGQSRCSPRRHGDTEENQNLWASDWETSTPSAKGQQGDHGEKQAGRESTRKSRMGQSRCSPRRHGDTEENQNLWASDWETSTPSAKGQQGDHGERQAGRE